MNNLNRLKVKIREAGSDIDVALTKRYDVLTKMIDTVKGYAKHEKETLFKVIELRSGMTNKERSAAITDMNDNLNKINVLAESYPELHSNENFMMLQKAIMDTEEHLQASRRFYNSNISALNQMIVTFPASIVASKCGITPEDFFEAEEIKKQDVKIDL